MTAGVPPLLLHRHGNGGRITTETLDRMLAFMDADRTIDHVRVHHVRVHHVRADENGPTLTSP
jgi:hypothetical protein